MRDALVGLGMIVETFETAITWDRFEASMRSSRRRERNSRRGTRATARPSSPAGSRTSIQTGRALLHRASPPGKPAGSSRNGMRSRTPWRGDHRAAAGRSPTTTPSAATTGPATTGNAPNSSPRTPATKRALDPKGCSTRGSSSTPDPAIWSGDLRPGRGRVPVAVRSVRRVRRRARAPARNGARARSGRAARRVRGPSSSGASSRWTTSTRASERRPPKQASICDCVLTHGHGRAGSRAEAGDDVCACGDLCPRACAPWRSPTTWPSADNNVSSVNGNALGFDVIIESAELVGLC